MPLAQWTERLASACHCLCPRSLMDKVAVFGTADVGPIPTEGTGTGGQVGPEGCGFDSLGARIYFTMTISQEVKNILEKLQKGGFEAYVVGGCVRDLLLARQSLGDGGLDKKPKDWDIATNALPEQIQEIFPNSFYENKFGTVTVKTDSADETLKEIEVTTYRIDAKYSDKRHPDSVRFTRNLKEDLARRDFTINAMALSLETRNLKPETQGFKFQDSSFKIIDPFGGQGDLKNRIIRAVGKPDERFNEDALRMLRAVRFAVELNSVKQVSRKEEKTKLSAKGSPRWSYDEADEPTPGWHIEDQTQKAIQKNAGLLQAIAKERIRDELEKIIMSVEPDEGILLLRDLGLLKFIIPELEKGIGVAQNRHHIYTIFEHAILSLKFAAQKKYNLVVRLAALLHDIAKPQAKRGEGPDSTFYNHDMMGAKIAARILERLHFSREIIERAANLVRHHMFVYDVGAVTEAGVRRLLRRAGPENMADLLALRIADRLGSGVPKAQPYRLRHFQYMVEKVQHDAISVKMLKINGHDIMKILDIPPGPKIGAILDVLLAEVIEESKKNNKETLAARAKELNKIDLSRLRKMAKEKIEEKKEEEDKIIKNKYWVE